MSNHLARHLHSSRWANWDLKLSSLVHPPLPSPTSHKHQDLPPIAFSLLNRRSQLIRHRLLRFWLERLTYPTMRRSTHRTGLLNPWLKHLRQSPSCISMELDRYRCNELHHISLTLSTFPFLN